MEMLTIQEDQVRECTLQSHDMVKCSRLDEFLQFVMYINKMFVIHTVLHLCIFIICLYCNQDI